MRVILQVVVEPEGDLSPEQVRQWVEDTLKEPNEMGEIVSVKLAGCVVKTE